MSDNLLREIVNVGACCKAIFPDLSFTPFFLWQTKHDHQSIGLPQLIQCFYLLYHYLFTKCVLVTKIDGAQAQIQARIFQKVGFWWNGQGLNSVTLICFNLTLQSQWYFISNIILFLLLLLLNICFSSPIKAPYFIKLYKS